MPAFKFVPKCGLDISWRKSCRLLVVLLLGNVPFWLNGQSPRASVGLPGFCDARPGGATLRAFIDTAEISMWRSAFFKASLIVDV